MAKKLTQEEFIERATEVHNGKYDYSKVEYLNSYTKVCIICPTHGEFWQTPNHHSLKHGCPKCKAEKASKMKAGVARKASRTKVCGIGVFDLDSALDIDTRKVYHIWRAMIKRCYDEKSQKDVTYKDCTVCNEWLYFSSYLKWYKRNYVKGWCVDKDILIKGNREYAPDKCCFVPNEINTLFNTHKNNRGKVPICGLQLIDGKYHVATSIRGKVSHLGVFSSLHDAFKCYKINKEKYIRKKAEEWKKELAPNVYKALMSYEVEITD